jgi:predicted HTH domain antitoxin
MVLTKSIRLNEEEARDLEELVQATGEVEASVLKRAALRGLRDERLDKALLHFVNGASSSEAAALARMPRARFLDLLADRGVAILDSPSTVPEELEAVAALLGDERLAEVARDVRLRRSAEAPTPRRKRRTATRSTSGRRAK